MGDSSHPDFDPRYLNGCGRCGHEWESQGKPDECPECGEEMDFGGSDAFQRSPAREFGHARNGYAVEFNLDGACACRTLTLETEAEAEMFKKQIESLDEVSDVEVVYDG